MTSPRALTARKIAALTKHSVHRVAPSLYVQIRSQGTRSWLFRYSRNGENQWKGALSHLLPAISKAQAIVHHKAMPYRDVPVLMAELLDNSSESAKALAFTILTVARTGETIGATPSEISLDQKLWVVPAERMKAGREHRVPLSDAALGLIGTPSPENRFVFTGSKPNRGLSNMSMLMLLRGLRGDGLTVHGFRSAFSTWARLVAPTTALERLPVTIPTLDQPSPANGRCVGGGGASLGRVGIDRSFPTPSQDPQNSMSNGNVLRGAWWGRGCGR
ncbi:MAG: tyrosine-type recombinase/integrase [Devosia sp.]|nr:tyrosine-type recombinase/integrase [Devosia sp.]